MSLGKSCLISRAVHRDVARRRFPFFHLLRVGVAFSQPIVLNCFCYMPATASNVIWSNWFIVQHLVLNCKAQTCLSDNSVGEVERCGWWVELRNFLLACWVRAYSHTAVENVHSDVKIRVFFLEDKIRLIYVVHNYSLSLMRLRAAIASLCTRWRRKTRLFTFRLILMGIYHVNYLDYALMHCLLR